MNILKMLGVNEKDMDSLVKGIQKYAMEIEYLYQWSKEIDKKIDKLNKKLDKFLDDFIDDEVFNEAIPEFKSMLEAKENEEDDNNV